MYFDLQYYGRVLRHVWRLRSWPGRRRTLLRLLLVIPLEYLFNATCFLLDYIFFPALWREKVSRPVFVVGHARSGTTLVHRLMAADGETFSYFLYWEMFFPSLLQKKLIRGLGVVDRKLLGGYCKRRLADWDERTFGPFRHMHDMSLWNAEEDQFVMRGAFVTQQWSLDIPMMDIVDIFHVDQMSARKRRRWLHHYRECIKRQLVLNGGDRIHLAKNPLMSGWVQSLIDTFPDARIVVMVRDPANCIPSVLKLVELTWKGKGWRRADFDKSLEVLTDISFDSFRQPRAVLDANPHVAQVTVDYRRLTTQPRETIQDIYRALELEYGEALDGQLRAQEEREKSHSTHFEYSIDDYTLSRQRIELELAEFYQTYNWPVASDAESPAMMN